MRISEQQRSELVSEIHKRFGETARIWLFGSRVDDSKRGGDIDLLVETERPFTLDDELDAVVDLEAIFDGGKVDLLVHQKQTPLQAIHRIAQRQGILI